LRVIIVITLQTNKIPITDPTIPTVTTTTLFSHLFSPYDPGNPVVVVECVVIGVVVDSVVVCVVDPVVCSVVDSVVFLCVVESVVVSIMLVLVVVVKSAKKIVYLITNEGTT
jgi:hypothetical protein